MKKEAYLKMMFPAEMLKKAAEEEENKKAKKKAENEASKSERRRAGKWHSENFGGLTSTLTSGLLGALIGGGLGSGVKDYLKDPSTGETIMVPGEKEGEIEPSVKGTRTAAGAVIGGATGVLAALLANKLGRGLSGFAGPRTLAKQKAYNESAGQTVGNYLVPGMSGWNKARTAMTKDEQDAVLQELLLKSKLKEKGLA